jgi:hypothetical protein
MILRNILKVCYAVPAQLDHQEFNTVYSYIDQPIVT